jgi:hypothetical protein
MPCGSRLAPNAAAQPYLTAAGTRGGRSLHWKTEAAPCPTRLSWQSGQTTMTVQCAKGAVMDSSRPAHKYGQRCITGCQHCKGRRRRKVRTWCCWPERSPRSLRSSSGQVPNVVRPQANAPTNQQCPRHRCPRQVAPEGAGSVWPWSRPRSSNNNSWLPVCRRFDGLTRRFALLHQSSAARLSNCQDHIGDRPLGIDFAAGHCNSCFVYLSCYLDTDIRRLRPQTNLLIQYLHRPLGKLASYSATCKACREYLQRLETRQPFVPSRADLTGTIPVGFPRSLHYWYM